MSEELATPRIPIKGKNQAERDPTRPRAPPTHTRKAPIQFRSINVAEESSGSSSRLVAAPIRQTNIPNIPIIPNVTARSENQVGPPANNVMSMNDIHPINGNDISAEGVVELLEGH